MDGLIAGFGARDQGGVLLVLHLRDLGCFHKIDGSARLDTHLG
jgi:hypothetical protein